MMKKDRRKEWERDGETLEGEKRGRGGSLLGNRSIV